MQGSKFNNLYTKLFEDNSVGDVMGVAPASVFSSDSYAPGDNRIPQILGMGKAKKGKKKKFPIIRRTFPIGL
jgi:hypothetical protein